MIEEWRAVPEYEGLYEVSNLGRVRSLDRHVTYSNGVVRLHKGRIIKQNISSRYSLVGLHKEGKMVTKAVHRLVTLAFLGPSELVVNHLDNDGHNNNLTNLEYCTQSHNIKHAYEKGNKSAVGINNGQAKFTEKDVKKIKNLFIKGYKNKEISELYGVAPSNISGIRTGRLWKHIK
jgi:hypothetical protein